MHQRLSFLKLRLLGAALALAACAQPPRPAPPAIATPATTDPPAQHTPAMAGRPASASPGAPADRAASAAPAGSAPQATPPPSAPPPIDLAQAARYFAEADDSCRADGGALWGVSLCGPTLLVDPATRFVVANTADPEHALRAEAGVYTGTLPADAPIANTAFAWSGARWSEVVWTGIPDDAVRRRLLFTHERFHRVQTELGSAPAEADNGHLATADGRAALRLEWRALAAALAARGPARTQAIDDALAFRTARRRQFPAAAAAERALEANEGLAEYTAIRIVGTTDGERGELTRAGLARAESAASYVRSFAYGSGPAYGLLLDAAGTRWRSRALAGDDLGDLLAAALHLPGAAGDPRRREARYGGAAVRREEAEREIARRRRVAAFRALLIDGPTLTLPAAAMQLNFDPGQVEPLDSAGTAYPTLRVTAAWGELRVTAGGALVDPPWSKIILSAPRDPQSRPLSGEGWTLALRPGWAIERGARHGDWVLRQALND